MNKPAIFSATPRGRQLRRRAVVPIAIVIGVLMYWFTRGDRYWPKHGCHHGRECEMKCERAHAICQHGARPDDPDFGICRCPLPHEVAQRRALYLTLFPDCIDPELIADDGDHLEWRCSGGSASPASASPAVPSTEGGTSPP